MATTDVAAIFSRYWGAIFGNPRCSPEHQVIDPIAQDRLLDTTQRTLSTDQAQEIDEHLTTEELALTIRHLRRTSAPGPDGLSAAFYRIAPDVFGEIFSNVFRYQFQRGTLLTS